MRAGLRAASLVRAMTLFVAATGCSRPAPPALSVAAPTPPNVWLRAGDPGAAIAHPVRPVQEQARGHDFAAEVRLLFRVVACAGDAELPPNVDARVVDAHCADLEPKIARYRARYVAVAKPFLTALEPAEGPSAVVYPFAGGDLVTALTTYPAARTYTTLSLELAGDPRRVSTIGRAELEQSLAKLRSELDELLFFDDYSKSETLKRTQRGDIPGELGFFLVALAVHDLEPVSLRYFRLEPDGAVHYETQDDIDEATHDVAEHRKETWTAPDFSEAFANSEIVFRAHGASPDADQVHRHLAVNLSDDSLSHEPSVLRHLEAQGKVFAMTKAASYLLWNDGFSRVRDYLLENMVFMVSDSTGIPLEFTSRAGFVDETFGVFRRSRLHASPKHNAAFRKLWDTNPRRKLPFRYGYRDGENNDHLLVTKRPPSE